MQTRPNIRKRIVAFIHDPVRGRKFVATGLVTVTCTIEFKQSIYTLWHNLSQVVLSTPLSALALLHFLLCSTGKSSRPVCSPKFSRGWVTFNHDISISKLVTSKIPHGKKFYKKSCLQMTCLKGKVNFLCLPTIARPFIYLQLF